MAGHPMGPAALSDNVVTAALVAVVLLCVLVDARRRLPSLRRSSARTVLAVDLGMAFAMALMVTGVA